MGATAPRIIAGPYYADGLLSASFVVLLIGEFVVDQQQWDFHHNKKAIESSGQVPKERFLQKGKIGLHTTESLGPS